MSTLFVKTGDMVKILAGKDKGKTGKILQTFPRLDRVVVEGVNITKRHLRSRRNGEKGQIIEFPMPIHVSNVALAMTEAAAEVPVAPKKRVTKKKA